MGRKKKKIPEVLNVLKIECRECGEVFYIKKGYKANYNDLTCPHCEDGVRFVSEENLLVLPKPEYKVKDYTDLPEFRRYKRVKGKRK